MTDQREAVRCRAQYHRSSQTSYFARATCATASGRATQTATLRHVDGNTYRGNFATVNTGCRALISVVVIGNRQPVHSNSEAGAGRLELIGSVLLHGWPEIECPYVAHPWASRGTTQRPIKAPIRSSPKSRTSSETWCPNGFCFSDLRDLTGRLGVRTARALSGFHRLRADEDWVSLLPGFCLRKATMMHWFVLVHFAKDTSDMGGSGHARIFPPLDPGTFVSQLVWLGLTFGLLYLLLRHFALPRIGEVIKARGERIQRDLQRAEMLKAEAEQALAGYEQALAEAHTRANAIAKDTHDMLSKKMESERVLVHARIDDKLSEAETRITKSKANAMGSIDDIACETASAIVSKLLGKDVTRGEVQRALHQRMETLPQLPTR